VRHALRLLASVAAIVATLGASPALAFKNIEGCDIVAFAAPSSPVPIPPERWEAYRQQVAALLADPSSSKDLRELALALVDIEKRLLASEAGSQTYQDYLASDSCRLLDKLNARAVDALLDEAAQSTPASVMVALRQVTQAALAQIDRIERSARFRSNEDRTLMLAGYYCFVAGAILSQLPPERQQIITLADFGETVACKDAGRTG
jgi:hypothetical protein